MIKIVAYQISEQIDIKKFKADYTGILYSDSSTDLFYTKEDNAYVYILNYGVVVFANFSDIEMSSLLILLKNYSSNITDVRHEEDFEIYEDPDKKLTFSYNAVHLPEISPDVIRIIMLNVGQSVALDQYVNASDELFARITELTNDLEQYGKLKISKTELLKFIGKTLNIKNRIVDDLYIIDTPDIVWEDEYLSKINEGIKKTFDLRLRFRSVEYTLKIVEENLAIFTQLLHHRESNRLEWIIIILILFEVVHLLVGKFVL